MTRIEGCLVSVVSFAQDVLNFGHLLLSQLVTVVGDEDLGQLGVTKNFGSNRSCPVTFTILSTCKPSEDWLHIEQDANGPHDELDDAGRMGHGSDLRNFILGNLLHRVDRFVEARHYLVERVLAVVQEVKSLFSDLLLLVLLLLQVFPG